MMMMKPSVLATLLFFILSSTMAMTVAESSQEEQLQLPNCKKIEVKHSKNEIGVTEVDVCKYNRTQFFINPLSFIQLQKRSVSDKFRGRPLQYKYYVSFTMLIDSKYILEQIAGRSEYRGYSVKFVHVKRVRCVSNDDFHNLGKDVQIDSKWRPVEYWTGTDEGRFNLVIITGSSLKTMSKLLAGFSKKAEKNIKLKSIIAEFEIPEYNEYIETLRQSVEVEYIGPKILGLINTFERSFVFTIVPDHLGKGFPRILENDWYLVQRRDTPGVDFNRNWDDYKNGFGNMDSDFWIGLDRLHTLTRNGKYGLRLEFETHEGLESSAEFKHFKIGSESTKYKLNISGYDEESSTGHSADCVSYTSGSEFATVDRDTKYSCAKAIGGGWWMDDDLYCTSAHFNNELRSSYSRSKACVHFCRYHYVSLDTRMHSMSRYNECLKRTRMFLIKYKP